MNGVVNVVIALNFNVFAACTKLICLARIWALFREIATSSWPDNWRYQGGKAAEEAATDGTAEARHARPGKLKGGSACVCQS